MVGAALGSSDAATAPEPPLPVIDLHRVLPATAQPPPPFAPCPGRPQMPVRGQRQPWAATFGALMKSPPCTHPVWSPKTDEALRAQDVAVLKRRDIIALVGGSPALVPMARGAARFLRLPGAEIERHHGR